MKDMKKYIRICNCCGNTFETDMMVKYCKSCSNRIRRDSLFYKVVDNYKKNSEYPISMEDAFNY